MHDGWIYQGRQRHMWFGHGTKPKDNSSAEDTAPNLGTIERRIHNLGPALIAALPASKRYHAASRLGAADHERLDRVMGAVVRTLSLGPSLSAAQVLGMPLEGRGVRAFLSAGQALATAKTHVDLRDATEKLAMSAQEMGLDRFVPFLREADAHLTRTGVAALLQRDPPATPTAGLNSSPIEQIADNTSFHEQVKRAIIDEVRAAGGKAISEVLLVPVGGGPGARADLLIQPLGLPPEFVDVKTGDRPYDGLIQRVYYPLIPVGYHLTSFDRRISEFGFVPGEPLPPTRFVYAVQKDAQSPFDQYVYNPR